MKKFTIFFIASLAILITGCAPKELSPEMRDLLNKNDLTSEQVYKGNYYFTVSRNNIFDELSSDGRRYNSLKELENKDRVLKLDLFQSLEPSDIKNGLEFKYFESECSKAEGKILFDFYKRIISVRGVGANSEDKYDYQKSIYCKLDEYDYVSFSQSGRSEHYEDIEKKIKENKINKELIAQHGDVKTRLKNLGITEQNVKDVIKTRGAVDAIDVESYVLLKEVDKRKQAKREVYEKSLKIQAGNQYICTDGFDSWILKYNDTMIIFGDRPFKKNPVYGWYERFMGDPNPVFIDRENSTITYSGNKATCRPR